MHYLNTAKNKAAIGMSIAGVITLLFSFIIHFANGQNKAAQLRPTAPTQLRVDLISHPERVYKNGYPTDISLQSTMDTNNKNLQFQSVNNPFPEFSWIVPMVVTKQTAFQLLVATRSEDLDNLQSSPSAGSGWNSGKLNSPQNINVAYNGPALKPNTIYYWKVCIWGETAGISSKIVQTPYSTVQAFRTGTQLSKNALPGYVLTKTSQKPVSNKTYSKNYHLYDFGKDGFSQPRIKIRASHDDTLQILLAEQLDSTGRINTTPPGTVRFRQIALPVSKGTYTYPVPIKSDKRNTKSNAIKMPAYIGEVLPIRYLSIQGDLAANKPLAVTRDLIHIASDQNQTIFKSSDPVLDQVWELCKYTILATSFTGYYVDGDRERIPYEADALINQLSGYSTSATFNMAKRTLNYLIYHPTWPTEWSLQNPLIAYNDYMYSGDDRNLANIYKELQPKVLTALEDANGLISTRTGKQVSEFLKAIHYKVFDGNPGLKDIVDWPHTKKETDGFVFTDYNAVVNAFYYKALKDMSLLAAALHKWRDADRYRNKAASVKKAYLKHFVNPDTQLIVDGIGTHHSSLHANMFALAFDLVPPDNIAKVLTFIKSRGVSCSVYGAQFLLDALGEKDNSDYVLKLLTSKDNRSWYNMIREGATMTMEAWGQKFKPNQDWNHAWGTAPANYIVRFLMGIQPASPGFEKILIKPHPGSLSSAKISYNTIRGKIDMTFQNSKERFDMVLTLPGNTITTVLLPCHANNGMPDTIQMDGQAVHATKVGDYLKIEAVTPGTHHFSARSDRS